MKGIVLAEQTKIVPVIYPVDVTGGATGVEFSMENYSHASVILLVGASAAAFTKIFVKECTNASAGGATAIAYYVYKAETANSDVLGARTAVAATGVTPSANDNIYYVIEIDAAELSDGYPWIQISVTNTSNAVIASAVAVLSGARYAAPQLPTAIA